MTLKEFSERLESDSIEDKIVSLRYKYSFEKDWTYSNEILEVDMNVEGNYVWLNDWNEGQEEIEILGYVNVSDVMISSIMNVGGAISRQKAIDALEGEIELREEEDVRDVQKYVRCVLNKLCNLPSVQSEPKKGKWTEKEVCSEDGIKDMEWQSARCSACGCYHTTPYLYYFQNYNYCPHCGSFMKGDKDE